MRILRLSIPEDEYELSMSDLYLESRQIKCFNDITINQNEELSQISPVRKVIKDFLNSRKSRTTIDSTYIRDNNAILIKGNELKKAIFIESIDFLLKAFYNFSAQYNLAKKGYLSWSKITNYYSSFFSINSLIRLQGRAITRIWNPTDGTRFFIFPYNFENNNFVICFKNFKGGEHKIIWTQYYRLYDSYHYNNTDFEAIYKLRNNDGRHDTEVVYRNEINYRSCYGFEEIWDPDIVNSLVKNYIFQSLNQIPTDNIVKRLKRLSTDKDYQYCAKSALRLLLSFDIIESIAENNPNIRDFWEFRKNKIVEFLNKITKKYYKSDATSLGRNLEYPILNGFS